MAVAPGRPRGEGQRKPRIGVAPGTKLDDYLESIRHAGGEPVVLDANEAPDQAISRLDGLLLTGGLDVDPNAYGRLPHPTTAPAPDRDRFEIPLSRAALERDVPIFAICRGVQVLNVAAGGTLVQDIPTERPTPLPHSIDLPKDAPAHDIRIAPGTRLSAVIGPNGAADACTVNSRHHQAVDDVAPSFVVSAVSPDGIIEAIERPDAAFCIGVQWHPENFWRTGEFAALFEAFVNAARTRR